MLAGYLLFVHSKNRLYCGAQAAFFVAVILNLN